MTQDKGELPANPKTGAIDNPQYPCYKAEGLCRTRSYPPDPNRKFQCVNDPAWCRYFKAIEKAGTVLTQETITQEKKANA